MKSRNSSHLHRLPLKYSDSDIPETPPRHRRKPTNLSFIEKSAQIIQNYGALLKKLPYQFGDAEAYFRQTLRNYDDFDFKTLKHESKTNLRNYRSLDNLRGDRKKSHLGSGDTKDKSKTQLAKVHRKKLPAVAAPKSKQKQEEEELDIFYSPSSQLTGDNSQVMAEGEESPFPSDFPEESEAEEAEEAEEPTTEEAAPEDPLAETEQLVQQASQEIDRLEEENVPGGEVMGDAAPVDTVGEIDSAPTDEESEMESERESAAPPPPPPQETPPEDKPAVSPKASPAKPPSPPLPPVPETPEIEAPSKPETTFDNPILKEVSECEQQCAEIAAILVELRQRVSVLLSKPQRSPEEDRELEEKQRQLNEKMQLLEQKTKKVEMLMSQSKAQSYDQPQSEDALPKVIICGVTENNMPKIIVCDGKKKKKTVPKLNLPSQTMAPCPPCIVPASVMPQFAQRLSESYNMQERLAAENADLEGKRYQLQEDLLDKDHTVESLQRKLTSLQGEMRMIVKENNLLNDRLEKAQDSPRQRKKMPCGKGKGICPADVEGKLNEYSETTQQLEKQLSEMEEEVRVMQSELVAVRQERIHLEQHRRMMTCPNVCPPPSMSCPNAFPCPMPPTCPAGHPCPAAPPCQRPPPCPSCCPAPCNLNKGPSLEQQLREMREKYNYLQEDYKGKLTEVAGLRTEIDKLKGAGQDGDILRKMLDDKTKECTQLQKELKDLKKLTSQNKEQTTELEQQLSVAKQRYREVKDELEEVRALVEEHKGQMEEYRNKYMQAQQTVEEQRRQIDMMELENARIGEQVNLEIQRVKNQFQEKLQELTPLPDILKATQKKLQEVQQMHLLAERKNELLLKDLQTCRDKAGELELELERIKGNEKDGLGEVGQLKRRLEECSVRLAEASEENDKLKQELADLREHVEEAERELSEKAHEVAQLSAEVENVRDESARQIARTKERCETIRRSMQLQITELERQLACCRALTRAAQKDRDEIRQKMQAQINNLNENFEDAQMRIRNLQGHVNFLKHSYTNVAPPADMCNCGSANEPMNPMTGDGGGMPSMGDPLNRCNAKF